MKIALLSAASSVHTIRWANGLVEAGHEVYLISQHPPIDGIDKRVELNLFPFRGLWGYFCMVPKVKKLLAEIQPDIINAHYASGYGTTGRLSNTCPLLLSVWGSDVYDFPYKSFLHRLLIRQNLMAADAIGSTSRCMAEQTRLIAPTLENITITPFGVDIPYYQSLTRPLKDRDNSKSIVIGTVKALAPKYGIDTLLRAFAILQKNLALSSPDLSAKLSLRIVGEGSQKEELVSLAQTLGVAHLVTFVGRVDNLDVPKELDKLDIYVALSRLDSESFGVAIVEAGAAGRPVVVSDAGGLPEVVLNGQTGIVVPRENPEAAAQAITRLILDRQLRIQMGEAGRQHVRDSYSWDSCVKTMVKLYEDVVCQHKSRNNL